MKIFINHLKCAADNLQQAGITFLAKNIYNTNKKISIQARKMTFVFTALVILSCLSTYFLQVSYWLLWVSGLIIIYLFCFKNYVLSFFTLKGEEQYKLNYHINDLACMLSYNENQQHLLDFFKAITHKYHNFPENDDIQYIIKMLNGCQFTEAALALSNIMNSLEKYLPQPVSETTRTHLVAVKNG